MPRLSPSINDFTDVNTDYSRTIVREPANRVNAVNNMHVPHSFTNLEVPEEEGEYETNAETHPPCDEEERAASDGLKLSKDHQPLRSLPHGLSEHPRLRGNQWNAVHESERTPDRVYLETNEWYA